MELSKYKSEINHTFFFFFHLPPNTGRDSCADLIPVPSWVPLCAALLILMALVTDNAFKIIGPDRISWAVLSHLLLSHRVNSIQSLPWPHKAPA